MEIYMATLFELAEQRIEDGDIFFVKNRKSFLSWIIQLFTKSNYSHCGICFWISVGDTKRLMCVEAQGMTKRRILNFSYYNNVDLDIVSAPKKWNEVKELALEKIGQKQYSFVDAVYVGIREFLLKRMNINLPYFNSPGEICSEFIATVYDLPYRFVSPQILYEELLEHGCTHKLFIVNK